MKKLYVVLGQTATGKTKYALKLASEINGELINADSRQIFKKLDIVSGKDLQNTTKKFHLDRKIGKFDIGYYETLCEHTKIWLHDIIEPSTHFSAFDFNTCALEAITTIEKSGKIPIVVGGTYLYIKNLLYQTININVPPDYRARYKLSQLNLAKLQNILYKLSPETYLNLNQSDMQNPHRIIRKIEVLKHKPMPIDNLNKKQLITKNYNIQIIGLKYKNIEDLKKAIEIRVGARLNGGACQEVHKLDNDGLNQSAPDYKTIGIKEIVDYLNKNITKEELIAVWVKKEIQYAKRQYTFMKQNKQIVWTDI